MEDKPKRIGEMYWLSEDEMDHLARLPRMNIEAECAMARQELRSRFATWAEEHPSETVVINIRTLVPQFGAMCDKAIRAHGASLIGDTFIAQLLPR